MSAEVALAASAALRARVLLGPESHALSTALARLAIAIGAARAPVRFERRDGRLLAGGAPVDTPELAEAMERHGVAAFELLHAAPTEVLDRWIAVLAASSLDDRERAAAWVQLRGLGVVAVGEAPAPRPRAAPGSPLHAAELYARAALAFREHARALAHETPPTTSAARAVLELLEALEIDAAPLLALVAREREDADRDARAVHAAIYALLASRAAGWAPIARLDLGVATLLADLRRASEEAPDTTEVWDEARRRTHRVELAREARAVFGPGPLDEEALLYGLVAESLATDELPVAEARLARVAWAYAALTASRPWRPPLSPRDALELLRSDARFDSGAVLALECALA